MGLLAALVCPSGAAITSDPRVIGVIGIHFLVDLVAPETEVPLLVVETACIAQHRVFLGSVVQGPSLAPQGAGHTGIYTHAHTSESGFDQKLFLY